jgi:hypothetical protein
VVTDCGRVDIGDAGGAAASQHKKEVAASLRGSSCSGWSDGGHCTHCSGTIRQETIARCVWESNESNEEVRECG